MEIEKSQHRSSFYQPQSYTGYSIKIKILLILILTGFVLIIARLFSLQVIHGEEYRAQALNNRKQVIRTPSYRGEIYVDAGKTKIVENRAAYSVYVIPKNFPSPRSAKLQRRELFAKLHEHFAIAERGILRALRKGRANPYKPQLIQSDASLANIHYLAEHLSEYPGIIYLSTPKRYYHDGLMYSHITGYIRAISSRELATKHELGYSSISLIGKLGIEAKYDLDLRGKEGYKVQIIDAKNHVKDELFPPDGKAAAGKNLTLTIDSRIQKIVYDTLQGYPGGAIVTRAATGEVLALYSYPSYDPNIFINTLKQEVFQTYLQAANNPFFNRVTQGEYPPSSIFKLVLSLAATDSQTIDLQRYRQTCYGGIYIGPKFFKCEGVHLEANIYQALANSCNVFFYNLGFDLGPQTISKYARSYFNFGAPSGIDLPYEKAGRIPDQKWKLENIGTFWWDGDTANFSIGQGYTLATIVQINTLTAALANYGHAFTPQLLKSQHSPETDIVFTPQTRESINLPFSSQNIAIVRQAMRYAVEWGTAKRINTATLELAGKTGTAQTYRGKEPHSWFTGFAPYRANKAKDTVAVTVLLENAGHGGEMAAPFAAAILEGIFLYRDPMLVIKEKLQPWTSKASKYEKWLRIRNEQRLPASHFQ